MSDLSSPELVAVDRACTLAGRLYALSTAAQVIITGSALPTGSRQAQEVAEYLLDLMAELSLDANHTLSPLID